MVVLRDEKRIANLAKLGRALSLAGLAALGIGLVLIFLPETNVFLYQMIALVVGWALAQVGLYFSHRYLRRPRMDMVIDKAVSKFGKKDGRLYHYLLPAPHVLLTPGGVVVMNAKYQTGRISADGDKWTQAGLGMRRFFGQENLGNPTREVEEMVRKMAADVAQNAPAAAGVPILPLIVFTTDSKDSLETKGSRIPAMHHSKVEGHLKQRKELQTPMSAEAYAALRAAFDARAGNLLAESVDADTE